MAKTVELDDETASLVEAWIADGHFASAEEAVRTAVAALGDSTVFPPDLDQAWIATKLSEAEADVAAGRIRPAEDVFADLLARFVPSERDKAG